MIQINITSSCYKYHDHPNRLDSYPPNNPVIDSVLSNTKNTIKVYVAIILNCIHCSNKFHTIPQRVENLQKSLSLCSQHSS